MMKNEHEKVISNVEMVFEINGKLFLCRNSFIKKNFYIFKKNLSLRGS